MNVSEVISSGLLESYVLGTTTEQESAMIQALCKKHPELLSEIEAIEESLIHLSAKGSKPINESLKDKIASQLNFKPEEEDLKIISLVERSENKLKIYRFAIAGSLILFVTSLAYNVMLQQRLSKVSGALAELNAAKSYMAEELKIQQTSLQKINTELNIVANPMVKTIALKGMNSLVETSAMIHWNTETSEVYFNASNLPISPASKQFQLWAIVDGKPIDAGTIDLNNSQLFQKMKLIKGATAFAVTIEKIGGASSPSLETMCLLGNV